MNPIEKLSILQQQEKILRDLILKLQNQKERLEIEEGELVNILNKKTSEPRIELRNEPVAEAPKVDLNLNPKLEVFCKVTDIEEEEEDDE